LRVTKTLLKLLEDRGFIIRENWQKVREYNLEDFRVFSCDRSEGAESLKISYDKLQMHVFHKSAPTDVSKSLMVFHTDQPKMGMAPIRGFVDLMMETKVNQAILILKDDVTPFARKVLRELEATGKAIQLFERYELGVNITEHSLVPKHELLMADQKRSLLERYKLKENQLPRIQSSDPIARYFGLKRGQVVKITRNSETAGRYITYRICI